MDSILKEVFENEWYQIEDLKSIDIPEMHHIIGNFEKNILNSSKSAGRNSRLGKRMLSKGLKAVLIAACILICSFTFSIIEEFPQAKAWKFRLVTTLFEIKDGFISIQQSSADPNAVSNGNIPSPPPSEGQELPEHVKLPDNEIGTQQEIKPIIKLLTIEQAEKEIPFALLVPQYVPEGFTFMEVKSQQHLTSYIIEQRYRNNQDQMIRIIQHPNVEQFGSGMMTRDEVKRILIMGEEAILTTNGIDHNMVSWYKDKCIYRIIGETSEEEFMKMLNSLELNEEGK